MKVRYLVSMAGPGVTHNVGDVGEVSEEDAARLCAAGYAEAFEEQSTAAAPVESTSMQPPENAALPAVKARKPRT